jgi:hypothetical protein
MGQSRTLNKGWAQAKGEYLGYLSSDDLLLPHAISTLVQTLESNPQAVVAYCDFDLIDRHGERVGATRTPDFDHGRMLEQLICPPGPGALFRRSVFERVGGWNPSLRKIPDFEFWLRAARLGPFVRIPQVLAQYRVHEESASIRPVPPERSMEIVTTMQAYWGSADTTSARRSLASAHLRAAKSHAQSGRPWGALAQFWRAATYRPKTLVSYSAWTALLSSFVLRVFNQSGRISARLR